MCLLNCISHSSGCDAPLRRARAWKTNLLLVAQAVLFIALTWGVDRAGGWERQASWSSCSQDEAAADSLNLTACYQGIMPTPGHCPFGNDLATSLACAPLPARSVGVQPAQALVQQRGGGQLGGGGPHPRLLDQPVHAGGSAMLYVPVRPCGELQGSMLPCRCST